MKQKFSISAILLHLTVYALVICVTGFAQTIYADTCSQLFRPLESSAKIEDYYQDAYEFGITHGKAFSEFVLSHRSKTGKTVIAVIMGGAEHLGTTLRAYLEINKIKNVEIVEVWLNRSITGYWVMRYKYSNYYDTHESFYIGSLGKPFPRNSYGNYNYSIREEHEQQNSIPELIEYTSNLGIWNADKVLVLDTGFKGGMADAMHQLSQKVSYSGEIEGLLFAGPDPTIREVDIKIHGYTSAVVGNDALWAYALDTGQSIKEMVYKSQFFGGMMVDPPKQNQSFQRSRPKVTKLERAADGSLQPNTSPYESDKLVQQHKSTKQGIEDGIKESAGFNKPWNKTLRWLTR